MAKAIQIKIRQSPMKKYFIRMISEEGDIVEAESFQMDAEGRLFFSNYDMTDGTKYILAIYKDWSYVKEILPKKDLNQSDVGGEYSLS